MSPTGLRMGIYRHYKGPLYRVQGIAHDANNEGRNVVIYIALQLDGAHTGYRDAVRTVEDFQAWVHEDGSTCRADVCELNRANIERNGRLSLREYNETHRPRFEFVGESWEGQC